MYNKIYLVPKVGGANIEYATKVIEDIKLQVNKYFAGRLTIAETLDDIDQNTIAIPVGGDGTVLYAAKMLLEHGIDIPIIGVNVGNVGFLTDVMPGQERAIFEALLEDDVFVEDKRTLVSVNFDGHDYVALNEFVISNYLSDNIIKYSLTVGESFAGNHKANGIIIATPTGSTAYAMNVGGSIIEPTLDVLQIIPIAALSMTTRPIIVSGDNGIVVKCDEGKNRIISLKADGRQVATFSEESGIEILISRYHQKARLFHFKEWNFFQTIGYKMGWTGFAYKSPNGYER